MLHKIMLKCVLVSTAHYIFRKAVKGLSCHCNKYKTTLCVDIISCTSLGFPSWCPECTRYINSLRWFCILIHPYVFCYFILFYMICYFIHPYVFCYFIHPCVICFFILRFVKCCFIHSNVIFYPSLCNLLLYPSLCDLLFYHPYVICYISILM